MTVQKKFEDIVAEEFTVTPFNGAPNNVFRIGGMCIKLRYNAPFVNVTVYSSKNIVNCDSLADVGNEYFPECKARSVHISEWKSLCKWVDEQRIEFAQQLL